MQVTSHLRESYPYVYFLKMAAFGTLPPILPRETQHIPRLPLVLILIIPTSWVQTQHYAKLLSNLRVFQTDPCGLQLFHLLEHTGGTGGATLLVDGFYAASILRELDPEAYCLLSEIPIPAHAAGEPTSFYRPTPASGYPVLGHDNLTRDLTQVRWNNDDRSVMSHLQAGSVEKW